MKINNKLTGIINERNNNNSTTYTIRIPHKYASAINSAIVFCNQCCYVVAIGNTNQIWTYELGRGGNTTMTAAIANHADSYVDVNVTFSTTIWGGISVICLN